MENKIVVVLVKNIEECDAIATLDTHHITDYQDEAYHVRLTREIKKDSLIVLKSVGDIYGFLSPEDIKPVSYLWEEYDERTLEK